MATKQKTATKKKTKKASPSKKKAAAGQKAQEKQQQTPVKNSENQGHDAQDSVLQTKVDQLVSLIKETKKISAGEAAKSIGVPQEIILDWAEFLEKEGIIKIQYKLATPYLIHNTLSQEDIENKAKEFHAEKESIQRKAEASLFSIEKQSQAFDNMKQEFKALKNEFGQEMQGVKSELEEFKKYDEFKRDIDNEMMKHQHEFKNQLNKVREDIQKEQQKYKEILDGIETEENLIKKEQNGINEIEQSKEELKSKLNELKQIINKYEGVTNNKNKEIDNSKKKLERLENQAEDLKKDIKKKKKKLLVPLQDKSKEYEDKVSGLQQRVLKKVLDQRKEIDQNLKKAEEAASRFQEFFNKHSEASQLLDKLEKDRTQLKKDYQELFQKTKAFKLATNSNDSATDPTELKKKLEELEKHKSSFESKFKKLYDLILSRDTNQ